MSKENGTNNNERRPANLTIDEIAKMTPQEALEAIDNAIWESEHFRGKEANMEKILAYAKLVKLAEELKEKCDDIIEIQHYPPNIKSRTCIVGISTECIIEFRDEALILFQNMSKYADKVVISTGDPEENGNNIIHISFTNYNVWNK